jgi:pyruvate kinase
VNRKSEAVEEAIAMPASHPSDLFHLLRDLTRLRDELLDHEVQADSHLCGLVSSHLPGARNLLHYLALRRRDIRSLQERLAAVGLSSLGRAEPAVLASVEAVLSILRRLSDDVGGAGRSVEVPVTVADGATLLADHAAALLGPLPEGRRVRIMVTMPSEAADDYQLVRDLVAAGMDCMRINCAHDNTAAWEQMIAHLRKAQQDLGRRCRVLMDLGGPKLRTGSIAPGPRVLKWRPRRDACGRILAPAHIWLTPSHRPEAPPHVCDAILPIAADWLTRVHTGERIRFTDARGARRSLVIGDAAGAGRWASSSLTSYVMTGTLLRRPTSPGRTQGDETAVGELLPRVEPLTLSPGDRLILTRAQEPGQPALRTDDGRVSRPARIACTLPEVFADLEPGEPIWLDDGAIGGTIRTVKAGEVEVEIQSVRGGRARLGADKGINLPESELRLPALTETDLRDLEFVARHADLVGLSFVHTAADVAMLQQQLTRLGAEKVGIVLKIETRRGFENLPELLLAAMRWPFVGVMIARGDLAVECGYERLAELQEEILWVCEAAHVPVIWATQVLENFAKQGRPSRAEITDAAMGVRAECVMLNKGAFIVEAVRALDDILRRMQHHQSKKRTLLRHLNLADRFPAPRTSKARE